MEFCVGWGGEHDGVPRKAFYERQFGFVRCSLELVVLATALLDLAAWASWMGAGCKVAVRQLDQRIAEVKILRCNNQ